MLIPRSFSRQGFTIVELLIVVVVIAILAAITIVSYNGIVKMADESALKSEVSQAKTKLDVYRTTNNDTYPLTGHLADTGVKNGDNVTFEYTSDGATFCLTGTSSRAKKSYYINTSGTLTEGVCTGHIGYVSTAKKLIAVDGGYYHTLGLTAGGTVYAWGDNAYGQLGDGTTTDSLTPIAVKTDGTPMAGKKIVAVSAGYWHNLALADDGTLYGWGRNQQGQLGTGATTPAYSTVPVAITITGKTFTKIATGWHYDVAIASDGTVYAWGENGAGQIGVNSTASNIPTPQAVAVSGTPMAGKTIVDVTAGYRHTVAVASDGSVYAWGMGGLLGGTSSTTRVPVAVTTSGTPMAGKTIVEVGAGYAHTIARASDGSLYAWGGDSLYDNGQLGSASPRMSNTPIAVTFSGTPMAGKTIKQISVGNYHSTALATDGTIYGWGGNGSGSIGDGTSTDQPTAVATQFINTPMAGKIITSLSASSNFTMALASDGTAFGWGYNYYGQIGDNTQTPTLTAVQTKPLP